MDGGNPHEFLCCATNCIAISFRVVGIILSRGVPRERSSALDNDAGRKFAGVDHREIEDACWVHYEEKAMGK